MSGKQPAPPSPNLPPQQRTFKLYEFSCAFGSDMHHFVFIQRESNSEAFTSFEQHLRDYAAAREFRGYPRVYTDTDMQNIQTSCLDLLEALSHGNDCVSFRVVLGRIEVPPCDTTRDESPWLEDSGLASKDPDWADVFEIPGEQVIDLQEDTFT